MFLADLLANYMRKPPAGLVLEQDDVSKILMRAVRFYAGYAELVILPTEGNRAEIEGIEVTHGDWALIEPLFRLYVDHDNAVNLEASRGLGADVYGRSVSEIQQAIEQLESEYSLRCFYAAPITI